MLTAKLKAMFLAILFVNMETLFGWGVGHQIMTREAHNRLPQKMREMWSSSRDRLMQEYCQIPDLVGRPQFQHYLEFIYEEPARPSASQVVWRFHYFSETEALNVAFSERAAAWYFKKMHEFISAAKFDEAAKLSGAIGHTIQDQTCPHCFDGWPEAARRRIALEKKYGIDEEDRAVKPLFFAFELKGSVPVLSDYSLQDYQPVLLGQSIAEAASTFAQRLEYEVREKSRQIHELRLAPLRARKDWRNDFELTDEEIKIAYDLFDLGAKLTADTFYTAFRLAKSGLSAPPRVAQETVVVRETVEKDSEKPKPAPDATLQNHSVDNKEEKMVIRLWFESQSDGNIVERKGNAANLFRINGQVHGKDDAIVFPGQENDFIQVGSCPAADIEKSFVLETEFMIVKFPDAPKRMVMITKPQAYYVSVDNQSIEFGLFGVKYDEKMPVPSRFRLDAPLETGKWYKLQFIYDGTQTEFFMDGKLIGVRKASGSINKSHHNLCIGGFQGKSAYNDVFAGKMRYMKLGEILFGSAAKSVTCSHEEEILSMIHLLNHPEDVAAREKVGYAKFGEEWVWKSGLELFRAGEINRVLTAGSFNIFRDALRHPDWLWENRESMIIEIIKAYDIDVLGIQEGIGAFFASMMPKLPDYDVVRIPFNESRVVVYGGDVIYKKNRFDLIDKGYFCFHHGDHQKFEAWPSDKVPRAGIWVILQEKGSGRKFCVYSSHVRGAKDSGEFTAQLLKEHVSALPPDVHVIMTGDFNMFRNHPGIDAYKILTSEPKALSDAKFKAKQRGLGPDDDRIDWLLFYPDMPVLFYNVVDYRKDGKRASDHSAIIATFGLK